MCSQPDSHSSTSHNLVCSATSQSLARLGWTSSDWWPCPSLFWTTSWLSATRTSPLATNRAGTLAEALSWSPDVCLRSPRRLCLTAVSSAAGTSMLTAMLASSTSSSSSAWNAGFTWLLGPDSLSSTPRTLVGFCAGFMVAKAFSCSTWFSAIVPLSFGSVCWALLFTLETAVAALPLLRLCVLLAIVPDTGLFSILRKTAPSMSVGVTVRMNSNLREEDEKVR